VRNKGVATIAAAVKANGGAPNKTTAVKATTLTSNQADGIPPPPQKARANLKETLNQSINQRKTRRQKDSKFRA